MIEVYTIGYTKKSAEDFFNKLESHKVKKLIDVRVNNTSQLAGFTRKKDLEFFLKEIPGIKYEHILDLAPTTSLLKSYRNKEIDWNSYSEKFLALLEDRKVENIILPEMMHQSCLLCSESTEEKCHRRLIVEYFSHKWGGDIRAIHI